VSASRNNLDEVTNKCRVEIAISDDVSAVWCKMLRTGNPSAQVRVVAMT